MKPAKYIRNSKLFLAFSNNFVHSEVARKVLGYNTLIHGAGFVSFSIVNGFLIADCFGHSESLQVEPRYDDDKSILNAIGIQTENKLDAYAHYIITSYNTLVFSNEIPHKQVMDTVLSGYTAIGAGRVSFSVVNNKIHIDCHGSADDIESYPCIDDNVSLVDSFNLIDLI